MSSSTRNSVPIVSSPAAARSRPPHLHRLSAELTDADQGRAAFHELYGLCSVEPNSRVFFRYSLSIIKYGMFAVSTNTFASEVKFDVHALNEVYTLSRAVMGTIDGNQAGVDFAAVPGRGHMLFSPRLSGAVRMGSGHRGHNITIERTALDAHFALLTGDTRRSPIVFDVMLREAHPGTAAIAGLAELFRHEIEHPNPSLPKLASLRDALLTALLIGSAHDAIGCFHALPPQVAPASVRRAEEYIAAHIAEPITLEEIVAAAGAPARSLQIAFQKFRGTTPMNFLRERRLELVRNRLLDPTVDIAVGAVLREFGLGHAGRFSAAYKQRFGETPSETRARRPKG